MTKNKKSRQKFKDVVKYAVNKMIKNLKNLSKTLQDFSLKIAKSSRVAGTHDFFFQNFKGTF